MAFNKSIGIDLGTANTLVFMKGQGVIMREPSVVAVDTKNDTVKFFVADLFRFFLYAELRSNELKIVVS